MLVRVIIVADLIMCVLLMFAKEKEATVVVQDPEALHVKVLSELFQHLTVQMVHIVLEATV